jgi:plasmid stability protein
MRQLTIRELEPEIEEKIREIANRSGRSLNQVIKEIIYKEFKKSKSPASSLRQLAGGWTRKEAAEFVVSIRSCEQIDEDMWK